MALSESSVIKLDKAGKTAGLQKLKTLDISSRNGKPWKAGNNGIQEVVGSIPIGYTKDFMVLVIRMKSEYRGL